MSVTFLVVIRRNFDGGEEMSIKKYRGLSPEAQRDMFNRAIVGYDPYHPDAPEKSEYKFAVPATAKT